LKRTLSLLLGCLLLCLAPVYAQSGRKLLTLQDVIHPGSVVTPGISSLAWRPDGKLLSFVRPAAHGPARLCAYDVERHREIVLLDPAGREEALTLESYQWSPAGDSILLEGQGGLWLLETRTGELRRLAKGEDIEVPAFSPSGDRVAFVMKHDLYVVDVQSGAVRRLTSDGSDTLYNGRQDWVYEEELANRSTARAFEWSPDGTQLAYLRLDDAPVPEYPITDYLRTHVSLIPQRFPQAGDPNPRASLRVVPAEAPGRAAAIIPDPKEVEYLGPSFVWTPDGKAVCFLALNRAQTDVAVHRWEPVSGQDRTLFVEHDPHWVNSLEPPRFLKGGREFLWVSERDGWQHVYLYTSEGKVVRQITEGPWMLDRPIFQDAPLYQLDPEEKWLYFAATTPDPRERQLYRMQLDGQGRERVTREVGEHTLALSPDGRFLADTFSAPDTPPATRLLQPDGAAVATIDSPVSHLADYAVGRREYLEVKAHDGATLYAELLKPPDFDPARKYPVIVDVYGGPHVQLVQKNWQDGNLFDQMLAENGFVVWTLDGRGSWGRGHAWETTVFENLGKRELDDQLAGVDYLKSLPYVDSARLGIRGWSYGGYMTLYALTHAPDVFKCGAAGAPVTDWKFYDSIYTERYMRTPAENPEGYRNASPLEAAPNLRARLLLLHGTSDDNVHMQNTINFLDALIRAGKPYELHLQPGQKHGFQGEAPRTYVDQRILDFFKQNL